MRERFRGTRLRLTLAFALAFTVVAGVAATAFWFAFAQSEYRAIDASLATQAQFVSSGLQDSGGNVSFNGGQQLPNQTTGGIAVAAIVVSPGGRIASQSGQVLDPRALAALAQPAPAAAATPRFETVPIASRATRVMIRPIDLGNGFTGTLILARTVTELQQTLLSTAILLAVVVTGLVLGAAALAYWLAGRALQPVRASFGTLQAFTADAAHELRAPLSLMRAQVDVVLRKDRTAEEYKTSHHAILTEIERLSRMADQLLLLARADAASLELRYESRDLVDFLEETIARWRPVAVQRGVQLTSDLPAEGVIDTDPDLLRRLLDNLIDNGVRHTPAGGAVTVSAVPEGRSWRIAVQDTGPGVDPRLRATLFERFTRADPARGRETGGAGLGLSLCRVIAELHGGSISLDANGPSPGARFVVRLPIQKPAVRHRAA